MKKLFLALTLLLVATVAGAGDFITFPSFPTRGQGPFDRAEWWNNSSLTFYAPFTDPANPLYLAKGTGTLSFTRATTATYVHPTTGLITTAADNVLRIESNGALIEGQRTNILLWSRVFDNAAWVKTNVSVAANQTGEDGVSNSAYSVWSTADNGTICQSVTIASAAFSGAFSLKRITGTGTVMISLDNGATYGSSVHASLSTSAWYRASKANQTLANPEICLKLGTSGDNVAVDYAQVEAGAFSSSRIETTTGAVTRNKDALSFTTSGNLDFTIGTVAATVTSTEDVSQTSTRHILGGDPSTARFLQILSAKPAINDGTTGKSHGTSVTLNVTAKMASYWGGASMGVTLDGATPATAAFDGIMGSSSTLTIGSVASEGTTVAWGYIKNLRIWNRSFSDAELQAITQ